MSSPVQPHSPSQEIKLLSTPLPEHDPAFLFNALVQKLNGALPTLDAFYNSSSDKKRAARRILKLFGNAPKMWRCVLQKLSEENQKVYQDIVLRCKEEFDEFSQNYVKDLKPGHTITLVTNSVIEDKSSLSSLDLPEIVLQGLQAYIDYYPMPSVLMLDYKLVHIVVPQPLEGVCGMALFNQKEKTHKSAALALLNLMTGSEGHTLNIHRIAMIFAESYWYKRHPLLERSYIAIMKEWLTKTRQATVIATGVKIRHCLCLAPIMDPFFRDNPRSVQNSTQNTPQNTPQNSPQNSPQVSVQGSARGPEKRSVAQGDVQEDEPPVLRDPILRFERGEITLDKTDTYLYYLALETVAVAYDQFIGLRPSTYRTAFLVRYADVSMSFEMQEKTSLGLLEVNRAYGSFIDAAIKKCHTFSDQQKLLLETRSCIEDIVRDLPAPAGLTIHPTYCFIMATLLLAHIDSFANLPGKELLELFDLLFSLDTQSREELFAVLTLPMYRIQTKKIVIPEREELQSVYKLRDSEILFLYVRAICNRAGMQPVPLYQEDSGNDSFRYLPNLRQLYLSYKREMPNRLFYMILESDFVAPEIPSIIQKFEAVAHEAKAFEAFEMVIVALPSQIRTLPNAEVYNEARKYLRQKKEGLEFLFEGKVDQAAYDFALSCLLFFDLSRGIVLKKDLKMYWFERLLKSRPETREAMYLSCLEKKFAWPAAEEAPQDVEELLRLYPEWTDDEIAQLFMLHSFSCRNLRRYEYQPKLKEKSTLNLKETTSFLSYIERLTRSKIPKAIALSFLKVQCVTSAAVQACQELEKLYTKLRREHGQKLFLPAEVLGNMNTMSIKVASEAGKAYIAGDELRTASEIYPWLSQYLNHCLLPASNDNFFAPFLHLFSQAKDSLSLARKTWAAIQSNSWQNLQGMRELCVSLDEMDGVRYLTLRFVDSRTTLNQTSTVKAMLPKQLTPQYQQLLIDLCPFVCTEQLGAHVQTTTRNDDEVLRTLMQSNERVRDLVRPYMNGESITANHPILIVIAVLNHLKMGMRTALWHFLDEPSQTIPVHNLLEEARKGKIVRCRAGFSLVPLSPTSQELQPHFGIAFAQYIEKAKDLYTKLKTIDSSNYSNRFTLEILPSLTEVSNQKRVHYEHRLFISKCAKNWSEYQQAQGVAINAHDIRYQLVKLSLEEDPSICVSHKFFQVNQNGVWIHSISEEEWCLHMGWLQAVLMSEYYAKKGHSDSPQGSPLVPTRSGTSLLL